uniref:Uncharacterized protein n=1 Tax=Acrobeloides nanus TaxID=290746 RepID=A0A914D819_9BILA
MNSSFLDASDDIEMVITEDEDDQSPSSSSNTPTKLRGMSRSSSSSTPVKNNNNFGTKYSQQTTLELKNNYTLMFSEFEEGAMSQGSLSPKHRRIASSEISNSTPFEEVFLELAQKTKSVGEFTKVPFPDLANPDIELEQQPLLQNPESMKEVIVQELTRTQLQNNFTPRTVFDLDKLISKYGNTPKPMRGNNDLNMIGKLSTETNHLHFESRFEGGNLRRAIQVRNFL